MFDTIYDYYSMNNHNPIVTIGQTISKADYLC